MNRTKWVLLAVMFLLAGAVGWWFLCPSSVQLSFVRYQDVNGERYAILQVENRGSEPLFSIGKPGIPDCHFKAVYPNSTMIGPAGAAASGIPGNVRINPGERLEFPVRLWLHLHQREVRAPFQAAINYTTPSLLRRHRFLQSIAFPYRFRPSIERTAWTTTVPL
jgi:hypothetical protein